MKEKVSKRILGFTCYVVGLGMAVASGVEQYEIDSNVILFVLGNGYLPKYFRRFKTSLRV